MAAGVAEVVRALQLAAVRAFLKGFDLQAVVAATHSALRGRGFSLGNGHDFSCILKNCVTNRLPGFVLPVARSEEHTSELQSLMRISYAVFCLKKKNYNTIIDKQIITHTTLTKLQRTTHRRTI